MVQALKLHPQMRYLDISANDIGSKGFLHFIELFKDNHSLQNLHVRKNQIKGSEILDLPKSLRDNYHLFYLDLKDNEIEFECADQMIQLLDDNYFIEDLTLKGNHHISQAQKETIKEECRRNLLIKEYILPHLTCTEGLILKDKTATEDVSHFKNYNVEKLEMHDMKFFRSDFIAKFIKMNRQDFHTLRLTKVHFNESIKDLAKFLKETNTRIRAIELDDCNIGSTCLNELIGDFKKIKTL